jgi:hypothetical protein
MANRLKRSCDASVHIAAAVETVWELVSDPTRTGEWSVACRGAEWLDGATTATNGARFKGRNRRKRHKAVPDLRSPRGRSALPAGVENVAHASASRLDPLGVRTRCSQRRDEAYRADASAEIPPLYDRVFATMLPQHRDRTSDLQGDLERIKERIETQAQTPR